jgi:hypothetical protein
MAAAEFMRPSPADGLPSPSRAATWPAVTGHRRLEDSRRLRAAGQIARTDELRAEVARAEADREFKKAKRDVDLASVALRSTLGKEVNAEQAHPSVLATR